MKKMLSLIVLAVFLGGCAADIPPPPPPPPGFGADYYGPPPPPPPPPGSSPMGATNGKRHADNSDINASPVDHCTDLKTKIGVLQATHASKSEINRMKNAYRNAGCG